MTADYALGIDAAESARLRRQSAELRPESTGLLSQLGLQPGQHAIDLGCGPSGILDLLAAAVGPGGQVTGVDADPGHVALATEYAAQHGLGNVEVRAADARHTGLPAGSFDLVHARTLLAGAGRPAGAGRGRSGGPAAPGRPAHADDAAPARRHLGP